MSDKRTPRDTTPKGKYHGTHRAEDKTEWDPDNSFQVKSPERDERGVGNDQTGGRDD